jgi:enoyl-CoA hydratase/carnithine racemase
MSYETIRVEMREAVGIITLNRPASLNALTTEVGQEFQSAVAEVQARKGRAVVITGAGRAFCAGGDLREMQKIAEREFLCRSLPLLTARLREVVAIWRWLATSSLPEKPPASIKLLSR